MAFLFNSLVDWSILITFLLGLLYYYFTFTFDYWEKRNIPFIKPVPLFGNSLTFLKRTKPASFEQVESYNHFKGERYYGQFNFRTPALVIKDPSLVDSVLIKDFTHFYNRGFHVDHKLDRLSSHLINLRDQKWKQLRTKLTPVFSSVKLKSMHPSMIECCELLYRILDRCSDLEEPFNARRTMADFTMDVIGHCAFGLQMNTLNNPNSEFRRASKVLFRPSIKNRIRFIIRLMFPKLLSWLKWKQFPKEMEDYFIDVIKQTMATRKSSTVEAQDFLQLLINLKTNEQSRFEDKANEEEAKDEVVLDDATLASNAMVFFLAGYDTLASTLSFCLTELAKNPIIQQTVREEIQRVVADYDDIPSFEAVKNMILLDQIISETLRLYPPVSALPRECTKDWKIPESDVIITKGTLVRVPVYAIHHDPIYYPEPDKFIPERFAEDNKHLLKKGTFIPYGDGPRICIGKRFAELQMKVALSLLLLKYSFTLNERTSLPLKFNPRAIFLTPLGGLWLNVRKLNDPYE